MGGLRHADFVDEGVEGGGELEAVPSGGVGHVAALGEADARLIAAAPDLLAALQRLVHPAADDTDVENALEVIARATGAA